MSLHTNIKHSEDCEDEYVVELYVNGEHQKEADYFTDDSEDAYETAEAMKRDYLKNIKIPVYRLGIAGISGKIEEDQVYILEANCINEPPYFVEIADDRSYAWFYERDDAMEYAKFLAIKKGK